MEYPVSILILAHNKVAYTRRCLDALLLSSLRPLHMVLVNNGSTDDTEQLFGEFSRNAAESGLDVDVLQFEENVGAIVGRNRGMERMKGQRWVFLDNDITVRTRSWLEKLQQILIDDPDIGVVGPKLVYPLAPHDIQCAGCQVTTGGQVVFCGRGEPRTSDQWTVPRDCQTLISACWMMPAHVAERVGEMDERFSPVQFEDIDYCYRIREAGWRCRYTPDVEMYHFENVTSGRTDALNYPYLTVKNGLKFKKKWKSAFESEGGPSDKDWAWAKIPTVVLEDVPEELGLLP